MTVMRGVVARVPRQAFALVPSLALAACVAPNQVAGPTTGHGPTTAPPPPTAPAAKSAFEAGVTEGPSPKSLPIKSDSARVALIAFRASCRSLVKRTDKSGLTRGEDWRPACDAAPSWPDDEARGFFGRYFETVRIGQGKLFATGYYEPEIAGIRAPQVVGSTTPGGAALGYDIPAARVASDPVNVDLGLFAANLTGRSIRGQVVNRKLVPAGMGPAPLPPEIGGAADRMTYPIATSAPPPGFPVPIYGVPTDLVEADLGLFASDLKGRSIKGRVESGSLVPYYDRGEIDDGALNGRGLEIGWAQDPIEFFFLQIQGSGRLIAPDGSVTRIGYAGQNGQAYVAIGKLLKDRGVLGPGQTTMQGVVAWLRANPDEGRAVMRENRSYVFFKEIIGPGPLGALGVPVVGHVSLAADPAFTPLGAPVWLQSDDHAEATGLWVAQDTGGAIKGPNRFDTFWGSGSEARRIAGGMSGHGAAYLLVPVGTLDRLARGRAIARP